MVIFLTVLPLWLIGSTGIGLWLWHRGQGDQEKLETNRFRTPISVEGLEDDLRKIVEIAGPRHAGSERGATGLRRTAAMIQGSLGTGNAGYPLEVHPGPKAGEGRWPLVMARLPGEGRSIAVVAGYDARAGRPGVEENGTGLSAVLAVAQALAGDAPGRPVTFAFVPHVYGEEGLAMDSLGRLGAHLDDPAMLLVVEAMGQTDSLMVSSRDTSLLEPFEGRARVVGAEVVCLGDDRDPASLLFEMGLPAVRVSTRAMLAPDDPDDRLPDPRTHAAATIKLAELVRDLAGRE